MQDKLLCALRMKRTSSYLHRDALQKRDHIFVTILCGNDPGRSSMLSDANNRRLPLIIINYTIKEAVVPLYLIFQVTNSARSEQNFDHSKLIPLRSFHQCCVSSLYEIRFLSAEAHILSYVLIYLGAGVDISTQFDQTSHEVDIARIGSNHEQRILILRKGGNS